MSQRQFKELWPQTDGWVIEESFGDPHHGVPVSALFFFLKALQQALKPKTSDRRSEQHARVRQAGTRATASEA